MTGSHLLVFGKCASCRTGVVVFFLNVLSAPFLGRCFCSGPFFLPGSFGQGRACRWKTSPVWRICADFTCFLWKAFYPGSIFQLLTCGHLAGSAPCGAVYCRGNRSDGNRQESFSDGRTPGKALCPFDGGRFCRNRENCHLESLKIPGRLGALVCWNRVDLCALHLESGVGVFSCFCQMHFTFAQLGVASTGSSGDKSLAHNQKK